MRAGKIDRRLTIRRFTVVGTNPLNEDIYDWADIATVWAQQRPNRGNERFAAQQIAGSAVMTFHIRYRDVSVTDRLRYAGKEWNITDVREIGRGVVTEIDAVARQD
ncbi:phage head closure protein [Mesorhizobium xinjiangense]|uniref:phage head closure protein n=1 Tax=Mesorhizobium xinjiangense TaxID=2678685 RepID=UPI0012EE7D85|nr:phage head closure protein [Mesorhizobium xinjiangense]